MALCMVICMAGCGKKDSSGGDMVLKAREAYEKLNSGEVTVTNLENSNVEQSFTFMIDKNKVMHYSSTVVSGNDTTKEYYNGKTLTTIKNGETTKRTKGEKGFPNYTNKFRHMKASKQMIIYEKKAIQTSSVTKAEDGTYTVTHIYNPKSVKFDTIEGKVQAFTVTYNFDKNKKLIDFTEETKIDTKGTVTTSKYKIAIIKQNEITDIAGA